MSDLTRRSSLPLRPNGNDFDRLTVVQSSGVISLEKEDSQLSMLKGDHDLKKADMVIVVMGLTGAGKSRLIREVTQAEVEVGHSLESTTKLVQAYHFMLYSAHVALIDTPGFDDTYLPDTLVFRELAAWLAARYQQKTHLTAVIYMQPINSSRMTGSTLRSLVVMKKMLGVQAFRHLVMVTSMWDTVDNTSGSDRETELQSNWWSDLIKAGARTARFSGDSASATAIIANIVSTQGTQLTTLTIQRELVTEGLNLDQTAAGTYLDTRILGRLDANTRGASLLSEDQDGVEKLGRRQELQVSWDPNYGSLWQAKHPVQEQVWGPSMYDVLTDGQIRLVELRAGDASTALEMQLVVENLNRPPRYAALSYVVGVNQDSVQVRLRQGRSIFQHRIAANLHTALNHLRQSHTDILVWVDALSINQYHWDERSQQVRLMSQIFRKADHVCIWLGPSNAGVNKAMDLARRLLDFGELESIFNDSETTEDLLHLASLMDSAWFRRRWCVQEILLARQATIHCGSRVMSWPDFVDAVTLLSSRWSKVQNRIASDRKFKHKQSIGHAHLIGALALIEISRRIFRVTQDGVIIERRLDLETLLSSLSTFEVTVHHDCVFAIYDLANDLAGTRKLRVDYSIEPHELFQDVMELIVRSSGSLDIIHRHWAPKIGLPSWIPTVAKLPYKRRRDGPQYDRQYGVLLVGSPGSRIYCASGDYSSRGNVHFTAEGALSILSARGVEVGIVTGLGGECINGNIPSLWPIMCGWDDMYEQPVPPLFWRTLVADRGPDGQSAPAWYKRACEYAFQRSPGNHVDTNYLHEVTESSHVRDFLRRVRDVAWSRTLASITKTAFQEGQPGPRNSGTLTRSICLCPSNTQVGDTICVLYGCTVPVVLRRQTPYYQLVGESFVYGLMNGEAVASAEQIGRSVVFDIV